MYYKTVPRPIQRQVSEIPSLSYGKKVWEILYKYIMFFPLDSGASIQNSVGIGVLTGVA